jgi:hypothetical protein
MGLRRDGERSTEDTEFTDWGGQLDGGGAEKRGGNDGRSRVVGRHRWIAGQKRWALTHEAELVSAGRSFAALRMTDEEVWWLAVWGVDAAGHAAACPYNAGGADICGIDVSD